MKIESNSAEETFALGKQCGEKAAAGQVYCLYGDLGVGKTVFTKGFAAGLGIKEPVSSPTFTILQVYDEGFRNMKAVVCHFITLMCTASVTRKKCTKLVLKNISREKASALSSGRT